MAVATGNRTAAAKVKQAEYESMCAAQAQYEETDCDAEAIGDLDFILSEIDHIKHRLRAASNRLSDSVFHITGEVILDPESESKELAPAGKLLAIRQSVKYLDYYVNNIERLNARIGSI